MPKIIIAIDGVVIKEVTLTKERTTLGRRPYNDVVIDNLAVSGEHAVLHLHGNLLEAEDLGSTNGTYLNGKSIKRSELFDGDVLEVGKYKIRYQAGEGADYERTMLVPPERVHLRPPPPPLHGAIKVLSGAAAGREVVLSKIVTTIGKPGVAVASITKRQQGFVLAHVEGDTPPVVNGAPIGPEPITLRNGDELELAGTRMQFVQQ